MTVTFPKLIATSNESVPTDSNKTDVTEPEEPEDEEDITSFTFALPTSDVSCDMNLDISKSDKKKEEP